MAYLLDTNILLRLFAENDEQYRTVRSAVEVLGQEGAGARLVAWMQAYDIHDILTLNPNDFRRYQEFYPLTVHTPADSISDL